MNSEEINVKIREALEEIRPFLKSGVELTIKKYLPQIETVTSIDPNEND